MSPEEWQAAEWRLRAFTNRQSEILAKGQQFDSLLAAHDALVAEVGALREALRKIAMESFANAISADELEWTRHCVLCDQVWPTGTPERHAADCLAQLKGVGQ